MPGFDYDSPHLAWGGPSGVNPPFRYLEVVKFGWVSFDPLDRYALLAGVPQFSLFWNLQKWKPILSLETGELQLLKGPVTHLPVDNRRQGPKRACTFDNPCKCFGGYPVQKERQTLRDLNQNPYCGWMKPCTLRNHAKPLPLAFTAES